MRRKSWELEHGANIWQALKRDGADGEIRPRLFLGARGRSLYVCRSEVLFVYVRCCVLCVVGVPLDVPVRLRKNLKILELSFFVK